MTSPYQNIDEAYRSLWGTPERSVPPHLDEAMLKDFPHLKISIFPPNRLRNAWIYATRGMSEFTSGKQNSAECFILVYHPTPEEHELAVQALSIFMDYAADHSTSYGQLYPCLNPDVSPESDNLNCNHLLTAYPFFEGDGLPEIVSPSGEILFLWLLPVTQDEALFIKDKGADAFEDDCLAKDIHYFGWDRPSILNDDVAEDNSVNS